MPPCAQVVFASVAPFFVTIATDPCRQARSAKLSPAMPLPTTMKS